MYDLTDATCNSICCVCGRSGLRFEEIPSDNYDACGSLELRVFGMFNASRCVLKHLNRSEKVKAIPKTIVERLECTSL